MKRLKSLAYLSFILAIAAIFKPASKPKQADSGTSLLDNPNEAADSPADLSSTGWKVALLRTKAALKDKDLSRSAAGLAYYATLCFFPVVLGVASLYVTFTSPQALQAVLSDLKGVVPVAILSLLQTTLHPLTMASRSSAGFAALLSVVALLWTMSGGLQNLIKATNFAYDTEEKRGFIKLRSLSLLLSVGMLLFVGITLVLLLLQGTALHKLGFPSWLATIFPYVRWVILVLLVTVALAFVYRYAPYRDEPHWQWVSWGAGAASIIWLLGTIAFFIYAQNFSSFNKTYGVFAGLVVLMSWFNLSSLIILVGAQVNKKLEEVTQQSTQSRS